MLGTLAGCDTSGEPCMSECGSSADKDAPTTNPNFRRLEIEIVGEGEVAVNEQRCTTSEGICRFDAEVGGTITLVGEFAFTAESGDEVQYGRCTSTRACTVVMHNDVQLVADVENGASDPVADAPPERRPFGLLPGQPGIVIDIFETPYSHLEPKTAEGGVTAN